MNTTARLFPLPVEVSPASQWCQRWNNRTHSWRHRHDGGFDADRYHIEPLDEAAAKRYITAHHYSATYPAALSRWALRDHQRRLVGVAVLGVPMSPAVLTGVFPDLEPMVESAELSRFVLADGVAANGESWFLGQVFAHEAARGRRGVVAFSDPVPRVVAGQILFPGHIGTIYQASNALYTGRSTARTLTVLPDGHILTARAAQKIRAAERGHHHVEARLVALGAPPRRGVTGGAAWLADALSNSAPSGCAIPATTATPSDSA